MAIPQTLSYGGYNVTPDWKKIQQANDLIYFNPNKPEENFTYRVGSGQHSPPSALEEFLSNGFQISTDVGQVDYGYGSGSVKRGVVAPGAQNYSDVLARLPSVLNKDNFINGYNATENERLLDSITGQGAGVRPGSAGPDGIRNLPINPSIPTIPNNLSSIEAQYQKLLSPTVDETQASQDINNLISSRDLGIESIRNKLVPMRFIAGESDALARQAAVKLQPLQQRLALLQAQRQSALDASRFSLERSDRQSEIAREQARYQSEIAREDTRYQSEVAREDSRYKQEQTDQQRKEQLAFQSDLNQTNNIGAKFYKYPGSAQVYDSMTGQALSYDQYKAKGGLGQPGMDVWPDIQEIGAGGEEKHSAIYQEWLDYANEERKRGRQPLDFNAYQTMDANRKKANISVSLPSLAKEFEYAASKGFSGDLFAYINAKAKAGQVADDDY